MAYWRYMRVSGASMTVVAFALCLFGLLYTAPLIRPFVDANYRYKQELAPCHDSVRSDEQVNCIFGVIEKELKRRGVAAAEGVFAIAYRDFVSFADGGCHTWAHRVGDFTYFDIVQNDPDLSHLELPQETTACGYGFYHGLLEHDIGDHPTEAFVTDTCDYLTKRLSNTMRDIELICYHASGHGFMVAESTMHDHRDWGDINAYIKKPAAQCASLPKANATDIEQCYEGIFNIIVNYMTDHTYGFSYDNTHPFAVCSTVSPALRHACIYEMAQKIDSVSGFEVARLIRIVEQIPDVQERLMAFDVGIAGFIQQSIAAEGYSLPYEQCQYMKEPYYTSCFKSIVWALFEHGDPQREYVKPLQFCADPSVARHGDTADCYSRLAEALPRFYTPGTMRHICAEYPAPYRSTCTTITTTASGTAE